MTRDKNKARKKDIIFKKIERPTHFPVSISIIADEKLSWCAKGLATFLSYLDYEGNEITIDDYPKDLIIELIETSTSETFVSTL